MIDLALNNIWLLGAALLIGVVTGRWAFSHRNATPSETKEEDEPQS